MRINKLVVITLTVLISIVYTGCNRIVPQDKTPHHDVNFVVSKDRILESDSQYSVSVPLLIRGGTGEYPSAVCTDFKYLSSWQTAQMYASIWLKPMDIFSTPVKIELSDSHDSWAACCGNDGVIHIVYIELNESKKENEIMLVQVGPDGSKRAGPEKVFSTSRDISFHRDKLLMNNRGEYYLLMYQQGVTSGAYHVLYGIPGDILWQDMGYIEGTDNVSMYEMAGFAVSPEGVVACAFTMESGELKVYESKNNGSTWILLEGRKQPSVPGKEYEVHNGFSCLSHISSDWGMVWQHAVSRNEGLTASRGHMDVLFARYDGVKNKWKTPVYVNDVRRETKNNAAGFCDLMKPDPEMMETFLEGAMSSVMQPSLFVSGGGRLAVLWTDFRDKQTCPVLSISDDGGKSWSRSERLNKGGNLNVRDAYGYLSGDGKKMFAVYNQWAGFSDSGSGGQEGTHIVQADIL